MSASCEPLRRETDLCSPCCNGSTPAHRAGGLWVRVARQFGIIHLILFYSFHFYHYYLNIEIFRASKSQYDEENCFHAADIPSKLTVA